MLLPAAVEWTPPASEPGALAFTSANGVALAGPHLERYLHLPVLAVGAATAAAAHDRGFADVRSAEGDAAALFARAAQEGFAEVLHLAGADRTDVALPHGLAVEVRTVYAARLAEALAPAAQSALSAGAVDLVLLYSARTARGFARLADSAGLDRARLALAALSPAIADAAGPGWRTLAIASRPREDALFASAGLLCDTSSG